MKIRFDDRILARDLRRQGLSFGEITKKIPNLSKGTLNGWLKDIELTSKQKHRLIKKMISAGEVGRLKGAFANHQKRMEITKNIASLAEIEVQRKISDPFFIAGVMLYWAEGDKSTATERVGFTNSDPLMIKLIMDWFRKTCNISENKFKVRCQIMSLHSKSDSEKFWSELTEIPLTQFHKTVVKPTLLRGKRNPSYMGTCTVMIYEKNLFRKIMGWKLGIIKKFNI